MSKLSLIGIISGLLLLVAMPGVFSPVYGQVTIDNERTSEVDLDAEPNSGSEMTATVTDTGYVHVTESPRAITVGSDGWTLQIEKNGRVETASACKGTTTVYFDNTGTVKNDGTIASYRNSYDHFSGNGIEMKFGTVENTGSIYSATSFGIWFSGKDPNQISTVYNTGTINGAAWGIYSHSALNVTNGVGASIFGGIRQATSYGVESDSTITNYGTIDYGGHGVRLRSGTVQNLGKDSVIYGRTAGVLFEEAAIVGENKVTNEGSIGSWDIAVYLNHGGIVENSGTIWGRMGILSNSGAAKVINSGTIIGDVGIWFSGAGDRDDDILDNSGTIIGTGGSAVNMGAGNDTAIFRKGTMITGWVDGGDGTDILELNDAGTQKDFMARNFETFNFTGGETILTGAGSSVNVEGDTTVKSGATAGIEGFTFNTGNLKVESTGKLINREAFHVAGIYTQGSDSTYEIGAARDHNFAKIRADKAIIDGGTIVFNLIGVRGGKHLIVGTTSGLQGRYDQHEFAGDNYAHWQYEYDPDNLYLTLAWDFTDVALTRNQRAVSRYLSNVINSPSDFISEDMFGVYSVLEGLDPGSFRFALDQLGGASHTAFPLIDRARQSLFFRTLFPRQTAAPAQEAAPADLFGESPVLLAMSGTSLSDADLSSLSKVRMNLPFGLWIRGYGALGNRDGSDIASRYDYAIGGAAVGMDFSVTAGLRTGMALGYAKTRMRTRDLQDNGTEDSLQAALYGSYRAGRWYTDAALSYGRNHYDTTRSLSFGAISRTASGSYDGYSVSGSVEGGCKLQVGDFAVTPLASLLAIRSHRYGFTEIGADSLNLAADAEDANFLQGAVGVRLARTFRFRETFSLVPEFSVRWVHEFGDDETLLNARFAGAPGSSFTVYSDAVGRDSGVVSLGLTGKMSDTWSFFLAYTGELQTRQTTHAATAGVNIRW